METARTDGSRGARRVLVLAYKFPDVLLPGGSTRVEKFVKYLPGRGWRPIVLSVRVPEAALTEDVHRGPDVHRTASHYGLFADAYRSVHMARGSAARRLVIEGVRRLKSRFLLPDDAVLWWPRALPAALRLLRRHRADAVFASGPPYSGLLLGAIVGRIARVPFVADVRDDWAGNPLGGRRNVVQRLTEHRMEGFAVRRAARVIHVTEASVDLYRERYPEDRDRMALVRNGYDEEDFASLAPRPKPAGRLRLLHTGTLNVGRSPRPLFAAMRRLTDEDPRFAAIRFRQVGTTHAEHAAQTGELGLGEQVEWVDRLPRPEVVREMDRTDAMVLLPTQVAPTAVPGKAYEYVRAARPLLVISRPNEATRFLARFAGTVILDPGDEAGIAATLRGWLDAKRPRATDPDEVRRYSREALTGELAGVLDDASSRP